MKGAILLMDGTVIECTSITGMIEVILLEGESVLAYYVDGASAPSVVRTTSKTEQEMILAFRFKCLNEAYSA